MGLFSFLKNAGSKIFRKKEKETETTENTGGMMDEMLNKQRATTLTALVESMGLDIDYLDVQVEGEKVTVSGSAKSQADREKVILTLGNVEGVAEVEDHIEVVEEAPLEATFYTVQKGDSLSKIAKAHYGDPMKYPVIFEANKPMLTDPNLIYPGQVLRIPNLDA
ncbi:MAG: peptidoglycan-binding protein LysM [Bacteroidota bacterium]